MTSCTVARTLRMYNVAIVLIIACKVISSKCIHTIYHSTRLAPQCYAFHLVILKVGVTPTEYRVHQACIEVKSITVYKVGW